MYTGEKVNYLEQNGFLWLCLLSKTSFVGNGVTLLVRTAEWKAALILKILLNIKMFKELWSYWASHEVNLSRENPFDAQFCSVVQEFSCLKGGELNLQSLVHLRAAPAFSTFPKFS